MSDAVFRIVPLFQLLEARDNFLRRNKPLVSI
jgi:hypothetical protein